MKPLKNGRKSTQRNMFTYGRIVTNLHEMARRRGFLIDKGPHTGKINIQQLHRVSGISTATLYYLTRHADTFMQLDFHTLAKLCFALDCQPGDLFRYERFPKPGSTPVGDPDALILDELPGAE